MAVNIHAAIAAFKGALPPAFDAAVLRGLRQPWEASERLIREGLPQIALRRHEAGAIGRTYRLDHPKCRITDEPWLWANFHEPQFTGGLCHYLNAGSIARALAFARAAYHCSGKAWPGVELTTCKARAEERKIDLLLELRDRSCSTFGIAIEAKFGHFITAGQLKPYRKHVEHLGWDKDRSLLLVVAPSRASIDMRQLRETGEDGSLNRVWDWTSWARLLRLFEQELDDAQDCEEFRRLRRTIWEKSYG